MLSAIHPGVALLLFFGVFFGSAVLFKLSISYSMALGAFITFAVAQLPLHNLTSAVYYALDSITIATITFFTVVGILMEHTGIAVSLVEWVQSIIGRVRGSIGMVCAVTSAAFGLLVGSSLVTLNAIGKTMIPEMVKRGKYSVAYASAIAASTCFLGILIPPSSPGIVYALAAGCSVMDVWLSTLIPGILITIGYCIVIYLQRKKKEQKIAEPFVFKEYASHVKRSTINAIWAILLPVIIFGGIYGGLCTPTEAGAIACVYSLAFFFAKKRIVKGSINKSLIDITTESSSLLGAIVMMLAFAACVNRVIAYTGIAKAVSDFVVTYFHSSAVFLLFVNILYLIIGCLMEQNAAILIMTPLLLPGATALGIDPVHFGAITLVNMCIGYITPPFAMSIFVVTKMSDVRFADVVREILPFLAVCLVVLALTTYIPALSMILL